jgi:hypothetical protein
MFGQNYGEAIKIENTFEGAEVRSSDDAQDQHVLRGELLAGGNTCWLQAVLFCLRPNLPKNSLLYVSIIHFHENCLSRRGA